ncbi:hypothetical protein NS184_16240, partial [Curtobacterium luteum]
MGAVCGTAARRRGTCARWRHEDHTHSSSSTAPLNRKAMYRRQHKWAVRSTRPGRGKEGLSTLALRSRKGKLLTRRR